MIEVDSLCVVSTKAFLDALSMEYMAAREAQTRLHSKLATLTNSAHVLLVSEKLFRVVNICLLYIILSILGHRHVLRHGCFHHVLWLHDLFFCIFVLISGILILTICCQARKALSLTLDSLARAPASFCLATEGELNCCL